MNKPGRFSTTGLFLFVLFIVNHSYSQGCCGIGGSLISGGHPVLGKNTFLASASGNYADAKDPERRRGAVGALLAYGITDRLSLSLKTSYVWATYAYYRSPIIVNGEQLYPGESIVDKNNGFGDGYAAAQFALIRLTPMNKQELIAGIDAGIPWGPDRKMVNGVVLIDNLQTGTGGYSVNGFLTYLRAFPKIHYSVASTIAGRIAFKTRRKRDPGDEFSVQVTSLFGPFFNTRESVTFTYFQKGVTYNDNHEAVEISSGRRLSIVPALEVSILSNLRVAILADLPLWRDKNQSLTGNDKAVRADIYWFIHKPGNAPRIKTISF